MDITGARRRMLLAAGLATLASPGVQAQARYPAQTIRILVGFPAGGTFDVLLRAVAVELRELLGQTVVIENRSGAGGAVMFTALKGAAPDGYTLGGISTALTSTSLLEHVPYDPLTDFTAICSLAEIPFAAAVRADSPFQTWEDLMAFGRKDPEKVFYGSSPGLAQTPHLLISEVTTKENLPWTVVPFRGSADCMVALLGGQLTFAMDTMISCAPHARAGKIRLLAIGSDRRQKSWPQVPTLLELGYTTLIRSFYGVGGPAGLKPEVVATLEAALRVCATRESLIRVLAEADQEPRFNDAAATAVLIRTAYQTQKALIEKYGLSRTGGR